MNYIQHLPTGKHYVGVSEDSNHNEKSESLSNRGIFGIIVVLNCILIGCLNDVITVSPYLTGFDDRLILVLSTVISGVCGFLSKA